jgi:hypothetical protein
VGVSGPFWCFFIAAIRDNILECFLFDIEQVFKYFFRHRYVILFCCFVPELNSLAIQCNPYIIEMLQNIAGFSRVAFISWQTLIWSFSVGSIIVAAEEYEEWNA